MPTVAAAVRSAYRHRAAGATGWPLVRGWRRLRPDPLRRLHLPGGGERDADQAAGAESLVAATSVPVPAPAARSAVGLAVREVAERAADGLPAPWPTAARSAARLREADLPDALDRAVARTDLGLDRRPLWWRLVGGLQWLLDARGGRRRWPGCSSATCCACSACPSWTIRRSAWCRCRPCCCSADCWPACCSPCWSNPLISAAAGRAARRAEQRLTAAVDEVAEAYVVTPIREVLASYAAARESLERAGQPR